MTRRIMCAVLALLFVSASSFAAVDRAAASEQGWNIVLQLDEAIHKAPYTGRVYLFFSKRGTSAENDAPPRMGPNWFHPQPFLSFEVKDWKPGDALPVRLSDESLRSGKLKTFPVKLTVDDLKGRSVQAVVRFNPDDPDVGNGEGNAFSSVIALGSEGAFPLPISSLVPVREFPTNKWTKLLRVRSEKLSRFHGRDVYLQGAVTVPASYFERGDAHYPVIIEIPGFGGDHFYNLKTEPVQEKNSHDVEFIRVMMDPRCALGHHVFANSANNGPYGDAFVYEFLPALDQAYRTEGTLGRYLTGHSSGGWSTLWLQVNYPSYFNGTWSTAPDPVDFREFQNIDLLRHGENMFVDAEGNLRPIARRAGDVLIDYKTFSQMEDVLGTGGQLKSFEAVFSPRGADGQPQELWNRDTGVIDPKVAVAWEAYNIRRLLEEAWPVLGPALRNKIHVFMGTEDTFYLEGAVRSLKVSQRLMLSDAVIELVPKADHFTLLSTELRERIQQEIASKYMSDSRRSLQSR